MMTTIDSHHHLWPREAIDLQRWRPEDDAAIRREFELDEFEAALDASRIDGSILMQSVDALDENDRLAAYAASSARVLGWVGFAALGDAARARQDIDALLALRGAPGGEKLVGLRCLVGAASTSWLRSSPHLDALRSAATSGLTWDVVPITDAQVDDVVHVAETLPALRIVIDHLASPPTLAADQSRWISRIERLAALPNVAIKLSIGVATLSRWRTFDTDAVRRYVGSAVDHFGPDRSMIASNWPVVLLRASHSEAWRAVTESISGLDAQARAAIMGTSALAWYGIEN